MSLTHNKATKGFEYNLQGQKHMASKGTGFYLALEKEVSFVA